MSEQLPQDSSEPPTETAAAVAQEQERIPLFGARARARQFQEELHRLRSQQERLGLLSAIELEQRREGLKGEIAEQTERLATERRDAAAAVERESSDARAKVEQELVDARRERDVLLAQVVDLREEVVVTEETALLQEAGVYEYRHPLTDSIAYQAELSRLKDQIKVMTRKDGGAVLGSTNWTVNSSAAQGRAMVRDFSKLMLRAYNAEADNLVRGLKPYKLDSAVERLTKVATTIVRLGRTMDIQISEPYHELRIRELELTADYLEKLAVEKEREREARERLKEERRAQQEMERERARLEKERQHYTNALDALVTGGDEAGAARMREELAEIERSIEDVDYRAANVRAGYVYVISNVGSFGDRVVKIGMTRRLEPLDRVRELGDASVPFRYDVHALFFSDDAVGIETQLHQRLVDRRVNRVNLRREFFYAEPAEVKTHLLELAGELLQFEEIPEAVEFHQSSASRAEPGARRPSDTTSPPSPA